MKELFESIEHTNKEIERRMETLGWFLYEVSDRDGDHEQIIKKLLALNPRFMGERQSLINEVYEILNISDAKLETEVKAVEQTDCKDLSQPTLKTDYNCEDKTHYVTMPYQIPDHGVIKVFNEPKFKLAICSPNVSDEFRRHAEMRKCPIQILDIVTQENFAKLEKKCREHQAFWNS